MGRHCAQCDDYSLSGKFSRNQWKKGNGVSRCQDCVIGDNSNQNNIIYQCHKCNQEFSSKNSLDTHMHFHRPRTIPCPVCGDTRFKSGGGAVQHVESGSCRGCRGEENARQQIYEFASCQRTMRSFLTKDTSMLTGRSDSNSDDDVPDVPYQCPRCNKSYRQLGQLLQHNDQKHGKRKRLGY